MRFSSGERKRLRSRLDVAGGWVVLAAGLVVGAWDAHAEIPIDAVAPPPVASVAPPLVAPPAPRRIEVTGAWVLDAGAIERVLAPADSVEARLGVLAALYADQGYFGATFRVAPDSAARVVRVQIKEGDATRIAAVLLRGNQMLTETSIREILGLQPGQTYRPPAVEARLDALVEEYARRGYLDAEAVLERCELGDAGVVLGIAMTEGERSQLVEIEVQGNTLTRSELVQRLAGLSTPRPADVRRIRDAPQLLMRSGLFSAVPPPQVYRVQGGDVGVVLRVVEAQRRNSAFGAVGMARDPARGRPYLTGGIDLGLRNIFGTGRDLDLEWRRDRILGSRLALGYRERFLFGSPIDLSLDLAQTVRDSSSTWQTFELSGFMPLNRNLGVEAGGAADRSVYHLGVTGNTLRWRAHVGMRFASLGREEDGMRFGNFEVRAETARRRADLASAGGVDRRSVQQTLWGGRFDFGVPLARRHVLAARGEWHALVSDEPEVPASELFEFGGARTLRGYREGQFKGDQVAFGGFEYRYGDRRTAQAYGFVDAGALRRKQIAAPTEESVHFGTGVGLRAQVASGALDVSFGMGEERSFGAIKVHVAFQQRF